MPNSIENQRLLPRPGTTQPAPQTVLAFMRSGEQLDATESQSPTLSYHDAGPLQSPRPEAPRPPVILPHGRSRQSSPPRPMLDLPPGLCTPPSRSAVFGDSPDSLERATARDTANENPIGPMLSPHASLRPTLTASYAPRRILGQFT